jgi:hypothetical protein
MAADVGGATGLITGELSSDRVQGSCSLEGEGASLVWEAVGPRLHGGLDAGDLETSDELCRVTGHVVLEGGERPVSCLGWQTSVTAPLDFDRLGSFRLVAAWFAPGDALSLIALRPMKARGQEADMVAASVLDSGRTPKVADPRLSTTYAPAGVPIRAGLELWVEQEESPEDAEAAAGYPRRAAGESARAAIDWSVAGLDLHGQLLRWHSHGTEGPGIYLLGQRG